MNPIIFLVSGGGGNLKFIYHAIQILKSNYKITLVISDRKCDAIKFAEQNNISNRVINITKGDQKQFYDLLSEQPSSVVVTNIHKILNTSVLQLPHRFINLHYSILPSFKGQIGMAAVDSARNNNCQFIGTTTHKLVETVDAGEIIQQAVYKVNWNEPEKNIHDTVFKMGCLLLLNSIFYKDDKNESPMETVHLNLHDIFFSHKLNFDLENLERNKIWKKINDPV